MASVKRAASFVTRKVKTGRKPASGGTFIQRSRSESSEQKAMFHQVTGAGRSHVLRQFFGLTTEEQQVTRTRLEAAITARLREQGA